MESRCATAMASTSPGSARRMVNADATSFQMERALDLGLVDVLQEVAHVRRHAGMGAQRARRAPSEDGERGLEHLRALVLQRVMRLHLARLAEQPLDQLAGRFAELLPL